MPLNSPNANSVDYHVWCAMLELTASLKLSQKQSRYSRNRFRLSGTIYHKDRSTRLWKTSQISDWRLVLELEDVGRHFEHLQWQWNFGIWSLVNCVVWLVSTMLLNWCCSLNIFHAEKSVNGHVKKSITSSFFNGIKFYLAFSRRTI